MTISITTKFEINETILSCAVKDFIEDYGYNADAIKMNYLDYVLNKAIKNVKDYMLDFIELEMNPEDKEHILFAFVGKFEEALHQDVEKALTKDC